MRRPPEFRLSPIPAYDRPAELHALLMREAHDYVEIGNTSLSANPMLSRTLCQRDDGYPLPPLSKVRIAVEEPLQVGISYATQPLEVFVGDLLR
jgi:hypothetical protein